MKKLYLIVFAAILLMTSACKEEEPEKNNQEGETLQENVPACVLESIYDLSTVDLVFKADENNRVIEANGYSFLSIFGFNEPITDRYRIMYEDDKPVSFKGNKWVADFSYSEQNNLQSAEISFEEELVSKVDFSFDSDQLRQVLWKNPDDTPRLRMNVVYENRNATSWKIERYNQNRKAFESWYNYTLSNHDNSRNYTYKNLVAQLLFMDPLSFGDTNPRRGDVNPTDGLNSDITYTEQNYPSAINVSFDYGNKNEFVLKYFCR